MKRLTLRKYCQIIEALEKHHFNTTADKYRYIAKKYPDLTIDQIAKIQDITMNKHPGYRDNVMCALRKQKGKKT